MSDELFRLARASLEANIVSLPSGSFLTAGRNQFKTLWTRDFAFAVRGLLGIGRADVVRSHLSFLIDHRRRNDGLVPRVVDCMPVKWRVVRPFLARILPRPLRLFDPDPPFRDPLRPEFRDEHGTEAVDSNLLVLLAAMQYRDETGDEAWWSSHEAALREIYLHYPSSSSGRLIVQPAFSDWQDSVRREGRAFYTNLLFATVSERLARRVKWALPEDLRREFRESLERTFYDEKAGLFRSLESGPQISIDGNLLTIDLGFLEPSSDAARNLYAALKRHPLWRGAGGLPGIATLPAYPRNWKSLAVRFANLRDYHEEMYWSWLVGLAGTVAYRMGDRAEGDRIREGLTALARRDGAIGEIFFARPGMPLWRSRWFGAEIPFSWGAGFAVELAKIGTAPRSSSG